MNPPSILDKNFRYVRSEATDIAKTFARIRREQKEAERAREESRKPEKIRRVK